MGTIDVFTPTFCNNISHLTTKFLLSEVWVLKFRSADMCAKDGEKHRKKRFLHVFETYESSS